MTRHRSPFRHAELVSASIVPNAPPVGSGKWTLKHVQGDDCLKQEAVS